MNKKYGINGKCIICKGELYNKELGEELMGHNAFPYPDWEFFPEHEEMQRCCSECNMNVVLPMRRSDLERYIRIMESRGATMRINKEDPNVHEYNPNTDKSKN